MPPTKLKKEFQMDEDDIAVVPIEPNVVPTMSVREANNKVKRPLSDKQKENLAKLVDANKVKWDKKKEEKEKAAADEKLRIKKEIDAKIEAGTHMRVKVVKRNTGPKPKSKKVVVESESESEDETEAETTEADSDSEDEAPPPRRVVRQARQAKKQIKTLQKIDQAIEQSSNPYMSKLMGKWH